MSRVSTKLKIFGIAVVGAVVAGATGAQTQGVINMPKVSARVANTLVGESVAACAAKNYLVTAVVVDLDGVRQAVLRGDGAAIHTTDNAFYKAYSSASITLGRKEGSTKQVADRMAKNAPSTVPTTPLPNITYGQGGVAIMVGERIIGGLGVSGAPGGNFAEECARAALAKVADQLK